MIIHTTHWFVLTYLFFHSFTQRVTVLVRKDAGYTNSKVEKARGVTVVEKAHLQKNG